MVKESERGYFSISAISSLERIGSKRKRSTIRDVKTLEVRKNRG
jgi:hypothetical protein